MSKSNSVNGTPGGGGNACGGGVGVVSDVVPIEPSENEPCMGTSSNNPKNVFLQFRDNACKKYQLTQLVFYFLMSLLVLVTILIIIVIALGAAWPHIPHSRQFGVCKEAGCLRAAAQIHEYMNESISPCRDIWSFSCGKFLNANSLPKDRSVWNQKQELIKQESIRVRDLITTIKLPLHTASVEWKLKHLYGACLDVDIVNTDGARPMENIISELGGWYILRNWNNADFDGKELLRLLHVKHRVTPFFKISVEPDPYKTGKSSIRISPSGLGLPDRDYYFREQNDEIINAYKELIRDVVINLSTTTSEAEKFGNDIFYYEKRIAEITPKTENLQNPITTCNHIVISELKETILTIPFLDILIAMYPESNVNENTDVIVTSLEYLLEISQIFASTERKTMNGYLIWTLLREYLPYLSDKFTSVVDRFNRKLYGVQEPMERWEFCANVVKDVMPLAINVINENLNPINDKTKEIVNDTFNEIVQSANRGIVSKLQKMPDLHNQLKQKLNNLNIQIGLPKVVLTNQYLKNYYSKLRIMKSDLFESIRNGIVFKKKLEEELLIKTKPEDGIVRGMDTKEPKVVYLPENNLVVVPASLLRPPYFEYTYPKSVIYGRLGVEITEAVLSAILPYDSFWISQKKLLSPYHSTVNDSLKSISNLRHCLREYFKKNALNAGNETEIVVLKQLSAVSVAFEALSNALAAEQHVHQPALEEFEDSSVFFLTYAQTQCSVITPQFQLYQSSVKFKLPQDSLLKLAWKQLPNFPQTFNCPFDSRSQCRGLF